MDCVIVMQGVAQVLFQLGKEAGGYQSGGCGIHAWFALLEGKLANIQTWGGDTFVEQGDENRVFTWPPEKPTATTPSSLLADRNLGGIVEGEVIIVAFKSRSNVE